MTLKLILAAKVGRKILRCTISNLPYINGIICDLAGFLCTLFGLKRESLLDTFALVLLLYVSYNVADERRQIAT